MVASDMPRLERMENRAEPTMMQTMKQEKTMPSGMEVVCTVGGSSTGVHRNTKMYMHDSSNDCTVPSNRIFSSLKMILSPSMQELL